MKNTTLKLSLLSVALLSQLHAENQYTLDTINVTASQGATLNKKDVTDSVTVITKEELDEARVTTLDEALNKLGGIAMTQNGGVGKSTSMFVRGMDTKRALVLIDGVRYNNPTSSSGAEFSQIMLYNVEQIEIIKGAQSGVWGSDAGSAVINIITSKAKKGLHGLANVEYGSFDTKKASLQASYATSKYDILIGTSLLYMDGYSAVEPKKSESTYGQRYDQLGLEKDGYVNQSVNAKFGYNISNIDRVEASIQTINSEVQYDSYSGTAGDSTVPNTYLQNRFYSLGYRHNGSTHDIKVKYNLSTFDRRVESTYAPTTTYYSGSVNELRADDKITYAKDSFLRVGASFQKFVDEKIVANETKSYTAISAFVTNYNKLNLFSRLNTILTESLRYDSYDKFDDALTGKLGAKQFVSTNYYISANVGTGYNVPSSYQLYNPTYGDTNLQPEKSFTSDLTLGSDTVWITGFYNEITDFIDFVGVWPNSGYKQISGTSKFTGVELGYDDYFFDSLGVNAMYTYLTTEDANGEALARRPKNQLDLKATYYVDDNWDLGLSAQYVGERFDSANNTGTQTGKYTVANFVSNLKVNKFVTVYGKIDNLTDKYYQTVDGYATAGRSLYFGLTAKY